MSRDLNPAENEALKTSSELLLFAAENGKDIPQDVVATITAAWDAKEAKTWDKDMATKFLHAFNCLCTLIQPVTLDSLRANARNIPPPKWKFWRGAQRTSLSRRSAGRYLFTLMILLVIAVLLGFLVSVETKLSADIEKMIETGDEMTVKMSSEADSLEASIGAKPFNQLDSIDQQKLIHTLQQQIDQQDYLLTQILQKTRMMVRVASLGVKDY